MGSMFHNSTPPVLPSISSAPLVLKLPVGQHTTTYTYHGIVLPFVSLPVCHQAATYTNHDIAIAFVHLNSMPTCYYIYLPWYCYLLCPPYQYAGTLQHKLAMV